MHHQSSKIPTDSSHAESERAERPHILTISGGSSSLKFALFALTDGLERLLSGRIERIGMPGTRLLIVAEANREQEDSAVEAADQAAVVHGDVRFFRPELVTLGVSETSRDLRDLLASQDVDVRAAEAVALFCYRAKTWLGALAAALGGLDTLVFAGGIGENSPEARHRICEGLEFPGISLDERRNAANAPVISTEDGRVAVRVIRTDEELLIARAAAGFIPRSRRTPAPAS